MIKRSNLSDAMPSLPVGLWPNTYQESTGVRRSGKPVGDMQEAGCP